MSSISSNNNGPVLAPEHSFTRLKRPSRCLPLDLSSAKTYRLSTLFSYTPEYPDGKTFIPPCKRLCLSDSSLKVFPNANTKSLFIPAYQFANLLQHSLSIMSNHSGSNSLPSHPGDSACQNDIPVLLVVDTRPDAMFLSHHITGAFHCKQGESVTVKAGDILIQPSFVDSIYNVLQGNYPFLKSAFTNKARNEMSAILQGYHVYVVLVYHNNWDEQLQLPSANSVENLSKLTPLSQLLSSICSSFTISVLHGGFQHFSLLYPHLCEKSESTQSISTDCSTSPSRERLFPVACPIYSSEDVVDDLDSEESYWFNCSASQILSFLFLGNEMDSQDRKFLRSQDIGYVLNVSSNLPLVEEPGINCHRIPVVDSSSQELKMYWKEAYDFIERARLSGQAVLVHCQAGVSRSATMVIAYLMLRNGWRLNEAYEFVRMRRKCIAPNIGFFGQLMRLENSELYQAEVASRTDSCEAMTAASFSVQEAPQKILLP